MIWIKIKARQQLPNSIKWVCLLASRGCLWNANALSMWVRQGLSFRNSQGKEVGILLGNAGTQPGFVYENTQTLPRIDTHSSIHDVLKHFVSSIKVQPKIIYQIIFFMLNKRAVVARKIIRHSDTNFLPNWYVTNKGFLHLFYLTPSCVWVILQTVQLTCRYQRSLTPPLFIWKPMVNKVRV